MVRAIWYQAKTHKLIIIGGLLLIALVFSHATATVNAATTCPTDTSRGEVTGTFTLTAASTQTYRVYSRMTAPSATSNTYVLEVDGTCYNVGGSSVPIYTTSNSNWDSGSADWIDAEATSTGATGTTPIDISLAPGSHSYTMIGNADNVRVDRVIFTQENGTPGTCVPKGVGDNCANDVAPTVSITSPANNATVSGTVTVAATADDSAGAGTVSKVELDVNGTAQPTNMSNTSGTSYTYSLDTTKLANGTYTLSAKAYDPGSNVGTSANVSITVNNATAPVCGTGTVSTPTGLSVVPNTANSGTVSKYTALNLSWSASTPSSGCTITGYNIYRDGSTTALNGATPVTTTTYTDSGFTAGTTHSYTVQGVDTGSNKSAKTTAVSGTTAADNVAPNMPTNLAAAAAGAGQVNLSWTASTDLPNPGGVGVAGYNIYRNGSTTALNAAPVTTTTYSDTTVSASTTYTYQVTAVDNANNESAHTTSVSATTAAPTCSANPSTPTAFHSTAQTATSIGLAWTASTASTGCTIAGYHIYRADVSTTTPLATVTSGTSYTDPSNGATALAPFTSYTYTITAFDTSGHSSSSAPTSPATIATLKDTTAPSAPGSVTATVISSTQVNLSWTASTDNVGVTGYNVFRNGSATPLNSAPVSTTSYSDLTGTPSTSYTYQVVALDGAGNKSTSTSSNQVTTQAPPADTTPPSTPSSPAAPVVSAQSAQITWKASTDSGSGVAGYHVYINGVLDTYKNEGTTTTNAYTAACLAPTTNYTMTIKAFDANGNVSSPATVSFTTSAGGYAGDFLCLGKVNGTDLSILATDWKDKNMLPTDGDASGDAQVTSTDLSILATNWGQPK